MVQYEQICHSASTAWLWVTDTTMTILGVSALMGLITVVTLFALMTTIRLHSSHNSLYQKFVDIYLSVIVPMNCHITKGPVAGVLWYLWAWWSLQWCNHLKVKSVWSLFKEDLEGLSRFRMSFIWKWWAQLLSCPWNIYNSMLNHVVPNAQSKST